jgi:hypothetical protein
VGKISSRDIDNVKKYFSEVQGLLIPGDKPYTSLPDLSEDEEENEEEVDDDDDDDGS